MPYRELAITDFAGLNQETAITRLRDNELTVAMNTARNGDTYGTRPGLAFEASGYTAAAAANIVQGGVEMGDRPDAGTGDELVTIINGVFYQDSGTTIAETGTTTSATGLWTFAQHKGNLYCAGGADGDTVCKWTGSGNVTKVTFQRDTDSDGIGDTDIDAKYIFQKWNYGFLAGMNGTAADDNPMIVRYSALNDMDTWPAGNSFGGSSAIGGFDSYGDNKITGIADFSGGGSDWLLVLTRKRIYSVLQTGDPNTPFFNDDVIANGCVGQHAFVSLGVDSGDAVFVSEHGIHSLRQSQQHGSREDAFLSWKIRETFADINKAAFANIVGGYWKKEGLLLFAVPTGSNTNPNLLLCLDMKGSEELTAKEARWSLWQPNLPSSAGITAMFNARDLTSEEEFLYAGTSDGKVIRFQRTAYSDLGNGYPVQFQTKHNDFDTSMTVKGLGDVVINVKPGGSYVPQYQPVFNRGVSTGKASDINMASGGSQWDVGTWDNATWGSDEQIQTAKIYGMGRGETIAHRFSHSGTDEPFFVSKVSYQIKGLEETTGALEN